MATSVPEEWPPRRAAPQGVSRPYRTRLTGRLVFFLFFQRVGPVSRGADSGRCETDSTNRPVVQLAASSRAASMAAHNSSQGSQPTDRRTKPGSTASPQRARLSADE